MAVMVKYVQHLPLMELFFFRALPTMVIVPVMLKNKRVPFVGNNRPLLFLRSLFSIFGTIIYFYTIKAMILTNAVAIKQLSPFFIILLASIFLREKITLKQIPIFIFAFLGALFIIKPGFRLDAYSGIIGLLGAVLTAGAHIAIRHLRLTDHHLVIVNYYGYTSGLASFGVLLWQRNFYIPDVLSLFILLLLGLVGLGAQLALTRAYQMAPINLVSFYIYFQIVFSTLLGILLFMEIPDLFSIFGATLIVISGYLNYKLNLRLNKRLV